MTAAAGNHAGAKAHERLAGCSGSPAVIGQPLRPVTLRPPPFAGGSPCQNILMSGIVAADAIRLRHTIFVDPVTNYLSGAAASVDRLTASLMPRAEIQNLRFFEFSQSAF